MVIFAVFASFFRNLVINFRTFNHFLPLFSPIFHPFLPAIRLFFPAEFMPKYYEILVYKTIIFANMIGFSVA